MLSIKCNNFCSNFSKGAEGRPEMTDGQAAGGATACLYSQFFHISRHSEPGLTAAAGEKRWSLRLSRYYISGQFHWPRL